MAMASDQTKDDENVHAPHNETVSSSIFYQVMNSYGREFVFILAVTFTAIAALQNGPLKSRKANPPEPFFTSTSLVTDFYQGNQQSLSSVLLEKDISLVMYYAPWDAMSMAARDEMEIAARFYQSEIYFAAINCWWPEGECSRKFKLQSYPTIVAYVHDVGGIYYEGPIDSNYIIAFLDSVLNPLVSLQHTAELYDLQTKHEGVLVAFFDFKKSMQPKGYFQFYTASLRALTKDPSRRLCFAIITNQNVALKFKLKQHIQIFFWNGTDVFTEKKFKAQDLMNWAYSALGQVTQWITPSRRKSKILSEIVEKAPTLILFTPRQLIIESSPYYDLFREVALDYYNCNKSQQVTSLIHHIVLKRHILQGEIAKLIERCHLDGTSDILKHQDSCDLSCCRSVPLSRGFYIDTQCFCHVCLHHNVDSLYKMKLSECENTLELVLKSFEMSRLKIHNQCNDVETLYPVKFGFYNRLSFKCHNESSTVHTKAGFKDSISSDDAQQVKDDRVLSLVRNVEKMQCSRLKFTLNSSELNFPNFPLLTGDISWQTNFTGLSCQTNRTLKFIAMDTSGFHIFAENLGIDILNNHHQSAAVIVEVKQESQYVLNEQINKKSLVEFIKNYTAGTLDRYLRSSVRKINVCEQQGSICVHELTTSTFLDFVLNEDNDVILIYYATWCGLCSAVSHVFLSVAHYFSDTEYIKFARINADENDLPWEYTVDRYPTIIFFPAHRKLESVEFPTNLPITTTNLLHFVLINSQTKVRWVIAMQMCDKDCVAYNLARSTFEIRHLFRDLRLLRDQLSFVRHIIRETAEHKKVKKPNKKSARSIYRLSSAASSDEDLSDYMKHLLEHIRNKKYKIKQSFHLQETLQKKRDFYLMEKKRSFNKTKHTTHSSEKIHKTKKEKSEHKSTEKSAKLKDEL